MLTIIKTSVQHSATKINQRTTKGFSKPSNKLFLPLLFDKSLKFLPTLYLSIEERRVKFVHGIDASEAMTTVDLIRQAIKKYGEIFIKPAADSGGSNTTTVKNRGNIENIITNLLNKRSDFVISNRLENETYSNQIYSESLNTYRAIIYNPEGFTPKIFRIFHRFGTHYSGNVDNCDKGGMVCEINKKTGTLGKALIYGKQSIVGRYERHIDSNVKLNGFQIPNWDTKIMEMDQILQ